MKVSKIRFSEVRVIRPDDTHHSGEPEEKRCCGDRRATKDRCRSLLERIALERERERMKAVDEEEIEEYKTRQSAALYSR